jgi:hypothetical protein
MRLIAGLMFIFSIFILGCAETQIITTEKMIPSDIREGEKYLSLVKSMNERVPAAFSADITLNASIERKSFKAAGSLFCAHEPLSVKIRLNDLIFKSPFAEILLVDDVLKIFVPVDKAVYVRRSSTSVSYRSLEIDPAFVSATALGKIPLLKNGAVSRSYQSEDGNDVKVVVFENENYYESIFFQKELPGKVLIIAKTDGSKYEIRFSNPVVIDGYTFYGKINATSSLSGDSFTITYKNIKINPVFDRLKIFSINIPGGTKVVE